jgi:hypothetical protein
MVGTSSPALALHSFITVRLCIGGVLGDETIFCKVENGTPQIFEYLLMLIIFLSRYPLTKLPLLPVSVDIYIPVLYYLIRQERFAERKKPTV